MAEATMNAVDKPTQPPPRMPFLARMNFLKGSLGPSSPRALPLPPPPAEIAFAQDAAVPVPGILSSPVLPSPVLPSPVLPSPVLASPAPAGSTQPAGSTAKAEVNLGNILKLVPAEVVAPFTILADHLKDPAQAGKLRFWFIVALAFVIVLRAQASRPKNSTEPIYRQVDPGVVGVSALAFVCWAQVVTVVPIFTSLPVDHTEAGVAAMFLGIAAPLVCRASTLEG